MLPVVILIPIFATVAGVSVKLTNRYCPQNYIGWILTIVGFGILTLLTEDSSRAAYIGLQIPASLGLGIVWMTAAFAILAPLPFSNSAHALAFYIFIRLFAQVSISLYSYA